MVFAQKQPPAQGMQNKASGAEGKAKVVPFAEEIQGGRRVRRYEFEEKEYVIPMDKTGRLFWSRLNGNLTDFAKAYCAEAGIENRDQLEAQNRRLYIALEERRGIAEVFGHETKKVEMLNGREFQIPIDGKGYRLWGEIEDAELVAYAKAYCRHYGIGTSGGLKERDHSLHITLLKRELLGKVLEGLSPRERIEHVLASCFGKKMAADLTENIVRGDDGQEKTLTMDLASRFERIRREMKEIRFWLLMEPKMIVNYSRDDFERFFGRQLSELNAAREQMRFLEDSAGACPSYNPYGKTEITRFTTNMLEIRKKAHPEEIVRKMREGLGLNVLIKVHSAFLVCIEAFEEEEKNELARGQLRRRAMEVLPWASKETVYAEFPVDGAIRANANRIMERLDRIAREQLGEFLRGRIGVLKRAREEFERAIADAHKRKRDAEMECELAIALNKYLSGEGIVRLLELREERKKASAEKILRRVRMLESKFKEEEIEWLLSRNTSAIISASNVYSAWFAGLEKELDKRDMDEEIAEAKARIATALPEQKANQVFSKYRSRMAKLLIIDDRIKRALELGAPIDAEALMFSIPDWKRYIAPYAISRFLRIDFDSETTRTEMERLHETGSILMVGMRMTELINYGGPAFLEYAVLRYWRELTREDDWKATKSKIKLGFSRLYNVPNMESSDEKYNMDIPGIMEISAGPMLGEGRVRIKIDDQRSDVIEGRPARNIIYTLDRIRRGSFEAIREEIEMLLEDVGAIRDRYGTGYYLGDFSDMMARAQILKETAQTFGEIKEETVLGFQLLGMLQDEYLLDSYSHFAMRNIAKPKDMKEWLESLEAIRDHLDRTIYVDQNWKKEEEPAQKNKK